MYIYHCNTLLIISTTIRLVIYGVACNLFALFYLNNSHIAKYDIVISMKLFLVVLSGIAEPNAMKRKQVMNDVHYYKQFLT